MNRAGTRECYGGFKGDTERVRAGGEPVRGKQDGVEEHG
jgi:hypothetical protein